jgi:hypothetical protein
MSLDTSTTDSEQLTASPVTERVVTLDKHGNLLVNGVRASEQELDALVEDQAPSRASESQGGSGTFAGGSVEPTPVRSLSNVNDGTDLGFGLAALTGAIISFVTAWVAFTARELRQSFASIEDALAGTKSSLPSSLGAAVMTFVVVVAIWTGIVFGLRSWHRRATNLLPLQISVLLLAVAELGLVVPLLRGGTFLSVIAVGTFAAAAACAGALYVLVPKVLR